MFRPGRELLGDRSVEWQWSPPLNYGFPAHKPPSRSENPPSPVDNPKRNNEKRTGNGSNSVSYPPSFVLCASGVGADYKGGVIVQKLAVILNARTDFDLIDFALKLVSKSHQKDGRETWRLEKARQ